MVYIETLGSVNDINVRSPAGRNSSNCFEDCFRKHRFEKRFKRNRYDGEFSDVWDEDRAWQYVFDVNGNVKNDKLEMHTIVNETDSDGKRSQRCRYWIEGNKLSNDIQVVW